MAHRRVGGPVGEGPEQGPGEGPEGGLMVSPKQAAADQPEEEQDNPNRYGNAHDAFEEASGEWFIRGGGV